MFPTQDELVVRVRMMAKSRGRRECEQDGKDGKDGWDDS